MDAKKETMLHSNEILNLGWVKVVVDSVNIEDEGTAERIVVKHIGAACILAITEDEKVLLVKQYRYPISAFTYEIPAGKNDTWQSNPSNTAFREFAEETPFTADKMEKIISFYSAPGFSDEKLTLFLAKGLKQNSTLSPDADEFLGLSLFTKSEIEKMLQSGEINDAKTIIALQYWLNGGL